MAILQPTRASLRAVLYKVLRDNVCLAAFCLDYFPAVARHLSTSMGMEAMLNTLYLHAEPSDILQKLESSEFADSLASYRHLLAFETVPVPVVGAPAGQAGRSGGDSGSMRGLITVPPPKAAYRPHYYISRPREEELALEALEAPGAAVVLQGPELFGKTWLLAHLLGRVSQRGVVVNLNLRALDQPEARLSFGDLLKELGQQILDATGQNDPSVLIGQAFARSTNAQANLRWLMQKHVLPAFSDDHWLILALDGLDALSGRAYLDGFLGLLRGWMESASQPHWSGLRLLASMSTAPSLLVTNPHQSPFNVSDPIDLEDLDGEQLHRLAEQLGFVLSATDVSALRRLVGGHPYLLRLALYAARKRPLEQVLSEEEETFVPYLTHVKRVLRQQPGVYDAYVTLLDNPRAPLSPEVARRLRHAGLVSHHASTGTLRPRYAIYQRLPRVPD